MRAVEEAWDGSVLEGLEEWQKRIEVHIGPNVVSIGSVYRRYGASSGASAL